MATLAISTEHLSKEFKTLRALDDLSLSVPKGIIFGFLGPNGSGKTTTIRLLLGLLEPTSGQARVLGFDTRTQGDQIREQTGALLEHTGLYEAMSVEDNLEFYTRVWRMPQDQRKGRIEELLSHMGLWDRRKDQAGKLSKGMKQKLALVRALVHKPALVLLDEPTAGLDVMAATAIREDLAALAEKEGATIFLSTHNMAEAEKLCSQVAVIRQGKLVALGSPDQLRAQTGGPHLEVIGRGFNQEAFKRVSTQPEVAAVKLQNERLHIELRQAIDTAPIVTLLVGAGVQVEEVRRGQASLEEVFLTLMEEEKI